jgi:hypothetical protein
MADATERWAGTGLANGRVNRLAEFLAYAARTCFTICFGLAAARAGACFAGQCVRIEGRLDYKARPNPLALTNEEHYVFRVLVEDKAWNIQMVPVDAARRPIRYFELGCDGETLYAYHEQNLDLRFCKEICVNGSLFCCLLL